MDKENFISLAGQLSQAGFDGLEYRLLQHICCRPVSFVLTDRRSFGSDVLWYQILVERRSNQYVCAHYDASLFREQVLPAVVINEVSLVELEIEMKQIEWQSQPTNNAFRLDDESTWSREKSIDEVIVKLTRLCATEDGKLYADILKLRFWSGTMMEKMAGSLSPVRSKVEVTQRFFFMNGEVISINEAYRFLQNSWMQKYVNLKKSAGKQSQDEQNSSAGSNGKSQDSRKKRKVIKRRQNT